MKLRTPQSRRLRRWPLLALVLVGAAGCDSDPAQPRDDDDEDPSPLAIRVEGASLGPVHQELSLFEGTRPLAGATVTVNGHALTEAETGVYRGQLPQAADAGTQLQLRVESQGRLVEGVGVVPDPPVLTTPRAGDYFDRSADVAFDWTSTGGVAAFRISLEWTEGETSSATVVETSGSARSGTVSPSAVPDEVDAVAAAIEAVSRGSFTGPADPASELNVRVAGERVQLDLQRRLTVRGTDMGPEFQNVSVYDGDQPAVGASVTVNGTALAESGPGLYSGRLPAALGAGEQLLLRVEHDGRVVQGTATITAVPILIDPEAGDFFDPALDLVYAWTSPQDPDEFEVRLSWVAGGAGSDTRLSVAGSARNAVLSTAPLPDDLESVSASVLAYLGGEFTGPAHPDSDMRVRLEGESADLSLVPLLTVRGGAMGASNQQVTVYDGFDPVSGAIVTVNGTVLAETSAGSYQGTLPAVLQPGEEIRLRVEADTRVVEGVATMIEGPVLTTPSDGDVFDPAAEIQYAWTSPTDPDYFEMSLNWVKDASGFSSSLEVPGSARSGTMSASIVPADPDEVWSRIYAYLRGTFTGPAHPDSDMRVRFGGARADFTLTPPGS